MSCAQPSQRPSAFELYAGAGNRFLLFESGAQETYAHWPVLARELCVLPLFHGERADGLLIVGACEDAHARMTLFNADGTRPEACGNGLRCSGWHLARTRGIAQARVATDAGLRSVRVEDQEGHEASLFAEMGHPRGFELTAPVPAQAGACKAQGYDLGNPHCILIVDDERTAAVEAVGRAMQTHADFLEGVNVGFLSSREDRWHLRVFERGVGETEACGTNACAAAACLQRSDGLREHTLHMPGGVLRVTTRENGALELRGAASYHGTGICPPGLDALVQAKWGN